MELGSLSSVLFCFVIPAHAHTDFMKVLISSSSSSTVQLRHTRLAKISQAVSYGVKKEEYMYCCLSAVAAMQG